MHKILLTAASLLLASVALAEVLDKSSTFTVEQDALTGNWNLECSAEVSGIDRSLDHSVSASVQWSGGTSPITLFNEHVDVLAGENRIVRAEDRTDFEIKKAGTRLKVSVDVSEYYPAGTGDKFICAITIRKGIASESEKGDSLTSVIIDHRIADAGTP